MDNEEIPNWKRTFPKKGQKLCQVCKTWAYGCELMCINENTDRGSAYAFVCPKCGKDFEGLQ